MKSAMIVAAVCAVICASSPVAVQAKGMTDMQIYCSFMPWMSKCAPAKPVAAVKPAAKPVAAAKPAPKMAVAMAKPASMKMMHCDKAAAGKPYLYTCTWK